MKYLKLFENNLITAELYAFINQVDFDERDKKKLEEISKYYKLEFNCRSSVIIVLRKRRRSKTIKYFGIKKGKDDYYYIMVKEINDDYDYKYYKCDQLPEILNLIKRKMK